MKTISFEWDESKNFTNQKKHGISFEEAKTVFYDESAGIIHDPDHSTEEDRFILMGLSYKLRILIVVHCYKQSVTRSFESFQLVKRQRTRHQNIHR